MAGLSRCCLGRMWGEAPASTGGLPHSLLLMRGRSQCNAMNHRQRRHFTLVNCSIRAANVSFGCLQYFQCLQRGRHVSADFILCHFVALHELHTSEVCLAVNACCPLVTHRLHGTCHNGVAELCSAVQCTMTERSPEPGSAVFLVHTTCTVNMPHQTSMGWGSDHGLSTSCGVSIQLCAVPFASIDCAGHEDDAVSQQQC